MRYAIVKRLIDLFGAVFLLVFFSPVMLIAAVVIKLETRGPAMADLPRRVGQKGRLFKIYKFRSMIQNAHELLKQEPRFTKALKEQQTSGNYKIMDDPRVTKVGRFIRKYSIDEMPQLFNVLKEK